MANSITSGGFWFPPLLDNAPLSLPVSFTSFAVGALTGSGVAFVGRAFIADRSASKIISAAGGGVIHWLSGVSSITATTAIHAIGIQDVAVAGPPGQPDLTYDVSASITGSAGAVFPANTWISTTMTSGAKTLSHGELYAFFARNGGSASVGGLRLRGPMTAANSQAHVTQASISTGNVFTLLGGVPNALFQCDDGTLAWLAGSTTISSVSAVSVSSGGTNTEYGMRFHLPWTCQVDGLGIRVGGISTADYSVILYSDPNGTPAAVTTITVLGDSAPTSVTGFTQMFPLQTPVTLTASVTYLLAVRADVASAITFQHLRFANAAYKVGLPGGGSLARGARGGGVGAFSMDETAFPADFGVRINQILPSTVTVTTTTTTTITTTVATGGMLVHPGMTGGVRG